MDFSVPFFFSLYGHIALLGVRNGLFFERRELTTDRTVSSPPPAGVVPRKILGLMEEGITFNSILAKKKSAPIECSF